jgi:hypothetical protein
MREFEPSHPTTLFGFFAEPVVSYFGRYRESQSDQAPKLWASTVIECAAAIWRMGLHLIGENRLGRVDWHFLWGECGPILAL